MLFEIRPGIGVFAVDTHLKVQMGTGGPAGGTNISESLSTLNFLTCLYGETAGMSVKGGYTAAVVNDAVDAVASSRT